MALFLVTGGAGFIGSNIAEELVRRKQKVRILDNLITGKKENIKDFIDRIEFIEGDIRDVDIVRKATKDVDFIIHEAALRSVAKSMDEPQLYNDVNINGTLNLLMVAKEQGVKRFVFASSSSIYGETDIMPEKEKDLPKLISPYALTKLAGEYYCRIFTECYGLETVCLRYFNVFGPRQDPGSEYAIVIPKFILCMLANEQPPIHGDGRQSRDFTYIDDVVSMTITAAITKNRVCGEVINVAYGKDYSVLEIVKFLNEILRKSLKPIFTPPRQGDVRRTWADILKAKRLLGFKPKIDFKEGLSRTVKWFKEKEKR